MKVIHKHYIMNRCQAILSKSTKANPLQCTFEAKQEGFCIRHFKLHRRFEVPITPNSSDKSQCVKRIQKWWRQRQLVRTNQALGWWRWLPADRFTNAEDFLTFEPIASLSPDERFCYQDTVGKCWAFRIDSFRGLLSLSKEPINPYNMLPVPVHVVVRFQIQVKQPIVEPIVMEDDEDTQLQQQCVHVFQKMDQLKQYTQCDWFLHLSGRQYATMYHELKDFWQYRLQLTTLQKKKYIPSQQPIFEKKVSTVQNRYQMARVLLNDIDRLITEGETEADRTTGAMWVMTALTLVSRPAREALPWLYESAV